MDSFFEADPKLLPIAIGTDNNPKVLNSLLIGKTTQNRGKHATNELYGMSL